MQTLDVQVKEPVRTPSLKGNGGTVSGTGKAVNGKTGAETARNGSSFLAMIEKMIAGSREGTAKGLNPHAVRTAGRGAGDSVPGDVNTLIKPGSGAREKGVSQQNGQKAPVRSARTGSSCGEPASAGKARELHGKTGKAVPTGAGVETEPAPALSGQDSVRRLVDASAANNFSAAEGPATADALQGPDVPGSRRAVRGGQTLTDGSGQAELLAAAGLQQAGASVPPETARYGKTAPEGHADAGTGKVERREKKAVISVRDERNGDTAAAESPLAKSIQVNADHTADMTIGFRAAENGSSGTDSSGLLTAERKDADGQNFASMLSQELRSNAADFVKTGHIILKDNNAGLIRLTLNPESLGNVKISLELSGDRKITGRIVVSSQEAYEAFNENLEGLSDAFVQGGFESAGFDLSWSGSGGGNARDGEHEAALRAPFYASSIPDVMSARNHADTESSGSRQAGFSAINVFA